MKRDSTFKQRTMEDVNGTLSDANGTDTNVTLLIPPVDYTLKTIFDVVNVSVQLTVMIAMGCVITLQDIKNNLKRPIGIFIALVSQFAAMPALTYGILSALEMPPARAFSAMITACSPGGSTSNLFTYLSDGNVSLSIMLTTVSTILATGLMPLNIWLYSSKWTTEASIKVPYIPIVITLITVLGPMVIGMIILLKLPRIAHYISKIGSVAGLFFIVFNTVLQNFVFPGSYNQPWDSWVAAFCIMIAGFSVGYLLSFILRQPPRNCRTIAIETGIQSISLTMAILILSFPIELQRQMTPFPMLYAIFLLVAGITLAVVVRCVAKLKTKKYVIEKPKENKVQVVSSIT